MVTVISRSPEETERLGVSWGAEAASGWVIGLSGDLGSGKTQLVKGIARGLGITERVLSPSFALFHLYSGGRLPLFHLDLYRLETRSAIVAAGLEEYLFSPPGLTVVEWVERWWSGSRADRNCGLRLPGSYRHVQIEQHNEHDRSITYEDSCG